MLQWLFGCFLSLNKAQEFRLFEFLCDTGIWLDLLSSVFSNISNVSLPLHLSLRPVCVVYIFLQDVCEALRGLAPRSGLHHDGVVFGSDDFCASIGSYCTFGLSSSLVIGHKCAVLFLLMHLWQRASGDVDLYNPKAEASVRSPLTSYFPFLSYE